MDNHNTKIILPALLVLLVLVGGYFWFSARGNGPGPQAPEVKKDNVEVERPDLGAASPSSRLPAGFPAEIPVDTATLTQSYKAMYKDQDDTQYTVTYTSTQSKDALWIKYSTYMASAKFVVDPTSSKTNGFLSGTKDGDTLTVIITTKAGTSTVRLNYLDR